MSQLILSARGLQEESLSLCQEINAKSIVAYALLHLGILDLAENEPDARERILSSLRLRQETREQLYQTCSLLKVAGLALHEASLPFATQLLGAGEVSRSAHCANLKTCDFPGFLKIDLATPAT